MDVFSAILERRSIRKYSPKPVEETKLQKVLEAARLAPSAGNSQQWKFIVVRDEKTRERLMEIAGGQKFVGEAPVVIVACGLNPNIMTCGQPRHTVDVSIAMSFLLLEAYEQGLGTCWLGRYNEEEVKELLGIPGDASVVMITPLGYPAESPGPRPRKELDAVVSYEKYQ